MNSPQHAAFFLPLISSLGLRCSHKRAMLQNQNVRWVAQNASSAPVFSPSWPARLFADPPHPPPPTYDQCWFSRNRWHNTACAASSLETRSTTLPVLSDLRDSCPFRAFLHN